MSDSCRRTGISLRVHLSHLPIACSRRWRPEDQGAVGGDLARLLGAGWAADRMEAGGADLGTTGHGFEPGGISERIPSSTAGNPVVLDGIEPCGQVDAYP